MIYFRFPFSHSILTADNSTEENLISFNSFDRQQVINFKGNLKEISQTEFLKNHISTENLTKELENFIPESKENYERKIGQVVDFIKNEQISKLVISRRKLFGLENEQVSFPQSFLNLCESYPNAFVYFFIDGETCWMGAFSEVLGKYDKASGGFETMSLAATLPLNEKWTEKEIEEQMPVTEFIKSTLHRFSKNVEQSDTYDHISGKIKHLRTDFVAQIKAEELENLIESLHPTPAVCGIPKDFCQNAIQNFEAHPRNFYSGFIKVETVETVQYFVNLRCAEFFKNAALIYVGGGITPDSSPEKEWLETELKAEAILKNLALI